MSKKHRTCDALWCYIRGLDKAEKCELTESAIVDVINRNYTKCISNAPFLAINVVFVIGMWFISVYTGVHYLHESSVDKKRLNEFASYLNNGLIFLMAFAFASNIQKVCPFVCCYVSTFTGNVGQLKMVRYRRNGA